MSKEVNEEAYGMDISTVNVDGNLKQSLAGMLSMASLSQYPEVAQNAQEVITHLGGDANNLISANLSQSDYQNLINLSSKAVGIDPSLNQFYESVVITASDYSNGLTDEDVAKRAKEAYEAEKSSYETGRAEDVYVTKINPMTGDKFTIDTTTGKVVAEAEAEAYIAEQANKEWLEAGAPSEGLGVESDSFIMSLEERTL